MLNPISTRRILSLVNECLDWTVEYRRAVALQVIGKQAIEIRSTLTAEVSRLSKTRQRMCSRSRRHSSVFFMAC